MTRIASGCTDEEAKEALEWHEEHITSAMSDSFGLHLTPHFSSVTRNGKVIGDYEYFDKPFGLKHWLENGDGIGIDPDTGKLIDENIVVILIDPDMLLLRPISADFSNERETIFAVKEEWVTKVQHGKPFAQMYELGTQWITFGLDIIAGSTSPAKDVAKNEAANHYPVGPPYLATGRDMYEIALKWSEFVPKVHAEYPYLLAEMFAFCIAAAHLKLPHKLVKSMMISNSGAVASEGWSFVDQIPAHEICDVASNPDHEKYPVPNVLHYCQRYIVGDWLFSKRKMTTDFFSCESPMMEVPPSSLGMLKYAVKPPSSGEKVDLSDTMAKREAFLICGIISLLNEAADFYKWMHCQGGEVPTHHDKTLNLAKS